MSTIATPGGDFIHIAAQYRLASEDSDHSHSTTVIHSHSNTDIPDNLFAKNLQVSNENSNFDSSLPLGLVVEDVTITEKLDLIDDAFIRVQPAEEENTSVLIGYNPVNMSADQAGVFVYKGSSGSNDVIVMNNKVGIRAPEHTIEGANIVSEWNVATNHDVDVGSITKTPQLRTTHIKLYSDGHTKLKIDAPIHIRDGGLNVSNMNADIYKAKGIDLKKGDIVCRKIYATGTVEGIKLFESDTSRSHQGKDAHFKTITINDGSIYIGLMRRSYDRATHKPVTHILKRQIPAYLVAAGFTLSDIPSPFTVENMTINNWVTLAQGFENDTTIEVDTVFPAATLADWESFIDPISIDLDAAELEIDDHETRIVALEAAGVTIVSGLVDNANVDVLVTDKVLLIKHDEKQGITCTMPATGMIQGQIISIKNMQFGDGSNQGLGGPDYLITVRPAQNQTPAHFIDFGFTSISLNATGDAPGGVNECARLMWESNGNTWIAHNDAY